MASEGSDIFKRIGLTIAKAILAIYAFGSGIIVLALGLTYFFDKSIAYSGQLGVMIQGKEMYILVFALISGIGAGIGYTRLPDFEDLLFPAEEDY